MSHQLENTEETLFRVHDESECLDRKYCPIHRMSDHSMRAFPQHFRGDRGIMERICDHGIGHPDPDDHAFQIQRTVADLQSSGPDEYPTFYYEYLAEQTVGVHGCDGCCIP